MFFDPSGTRHTPDHQVPSKFQRMCRNWREDALESLDLELVYGDYLTGVIHSDWSLQCRDPESPSGDAHPSASVNTVAKDGCERGYFYSYRTEEGYSVFDFLVKYDPEVEDFYQAKKKIAALSGVPMPKGMLRRADRSK